MPAVVPCLSILSSYYCDNRNLPKSAISPLPEVTPYNSQINLVDALPQRIFRSFLRENILIRSSSNSHNFCSSLFKSDSTMEIFYPILWSFVRWINYSHQYSCIIWHWLFWTSVPELVSHQDGIYVYSDYHINHRQFLIIGICQSGLSLLICFQSLLILADSLIHFNCGQTWQNANDKGSDFELKPNSLLILSDTSYFGFPIWTLLKPKW